MSVPLVSHVLDTSPYRGAYLLIHLVIADRVDEKLVLRVSHRWLAVRARVSRNTVACFVNRAVDDGLLQVLGSAPRGAFDYRLICPDWLNPEPDTGSQVSRRRNPLRLTSEPVTGHDWPTTGSDAMQNGRTTGSPVRAHLKTSTSPSVVGARAYAREGDPAATAETEKRDGEETTKKKDRLAEWVADAVTEASYADALNCVAELRAQGVGDGVIEEAAGLALDRGGVRSLKFIGTTARDWMRQRDPGWQS